jgi:hypothetical protein
MSVETLLIFALGAAFGSAVVLASYRNKHIIDRHLFTKFLGHLLGNAFLAVIAAAVLYWTGAYLASLVRSALSF